MFYSYTTFDIMTEFNKLAYTSTDEVSAVLDSCIFVFSLNNQLPTYMLVHTYLCMGYNSIGGQATSSDIKFDPPFRVPILHDRPRGCIFSDPTLEQTQRKGISAT